MTYRLPKSVESSLRTDESLVKRFSCPEAALMLAIINCAFEDVGMKIRDRPQRKPSKPKKPKGTNGGWAAYGSRVMEYRKDCIRFNERTWDHDRKVEVRHMARAWVMDRNGLSTGPRISFDKVCGMVSIDPDVIRMALIRTTKWARRYE